MNLIRSRSKERWGSRQLRSQHWPRRSNTIPLVAIGASAGGLDALPALLAKLSPDTGMAFVVIQHLDPARPSALASLLSKVRSLPVLEISNRITVQANHIYVVPANKKGSISNGTLALGGVGKQPRRPINDFMAALAKARGETAIVVFSGRVRMARSVSRQSRPRMILPSPRIPRPLHGQQCR